MKELLANCVDGQWNSSFNWQYILCCLKYPNKTNLSFLFFLPEPGSLLEYGYLSGAFYHFLEMEDVKNDKQMLSETSSLSHHDDHSSEEFTKNLVLNAKAETEGDLSIGENT